MHVHSLLVATKGVGKGGWAGQAQQWDLAQKLWETLWWWGTSGGKTCHVGLLVSPRGRVTMQTLGALVGGQAPWGEVSFEK